MFWSAGANGCNDANSGQVTASISVTEFNFMVQDPSGIIVRSKARSLSAKFRKYRIMAVSLWFVLKTGWVRYLLVRWNLAGIASPVASLTPRIERTSLKSCSVVSSSKEMRSSVPLTFRKLIPFATALSWMASASSTITCTVSKTASSLLLIAAWSREANPLTLSAISLRPAGPCHIA